MSKTKTDEFVIQLPKRMQSLVRKKLAENKLGKHARVGRMTKKVPVLGIGVMEDDFGSALVCYMRKDVEMSDDKLAGFIVSQVKRCLHDLKKGT